MAFAYAAGQVLTADDLNAHNPVSAVKGVAEPLVANTTLQADDELFVDLVAGRRYQIRCVISVTGAAAADVKTAWANTGTMSAVGIRTSLGPAVGTADASATLMHSQAHGFGTAFGYGLDGSTASRIEENLVIECTVSGRLSLMWAQLASSATATVVGVGSWITATPLA